MGRWFAPSRTSERVPGTTEPSPIRTAASSTARRASSFGALMSTWMKHRSATTFGLVPPVSTPAFTVTPGHCPFSSCSSMTLFAPSSTALAPRCGSTPACAARPVMSMRRSVTPLRAVTSSPLPRAGSSTNATSASAATSWMIAFENVEPISSSGLHT